MWSHSQIMGECIYIKRGEYCIEVTLLEIMEGKTEHKKARFGIKGVKGLDALTLSRKDGLVQILDDVKIGVKQIRTGVVPQLGEGNKCLYVRTLYDAPPDYKFECKEYE